MRKTKCYARGTFCGDIFAGNFFFVGFFVEVNFFWMKVLLVVVVILVCVGDEFVWLIDFHFFRGLSLTSCGRS